MSVNKIIGRLTIFSKCFLLLLCAQIIGIAQAHAQSQCSVKVRVNTESADALLEFFDNPTVENRNRVLAAEGTQIMESVILKRMGSGTPRFSEQLDSFMHKGSLISDPYMLNLASQQKEASENLLNLVKSKDIATQAIQRVLEVFPDTLVPQVTFKAYFVLTGWEHGDAYTRPIKKTESGYKLTKDGTPVMLFNLSLISNNVGYGETQEIQFKALSSVFAHELFHAVFHAYKNASPKWQAYRDTTYLGILAELIENEGIAHYIQMKPLLKQYYLHPTEKWNFPVLEAKAFHLLSRATTQLLNPEISDLEKGKLLENANTGRFWTKYGSISGMFMVYHITRVFGISGMQKSVVEGPVTFFALYDSARAQNPSLPNLPRALKLWANLK